MQRLAPALALISCLLDLPGGGAAVAADQDLSSSRQYKETVNLLETWINAVVDFDRLPGLSIAVVHDQEVVYAKGFGYADLDQRVKATPATTYSICSMSKMFTAIAVMQLRDAGKLDLDDPVSKHLPWFAPELLGDETPAPTLRDLLRHSGGLPCEPDHTVWSDPDQTYPSREELVRRVADLKLSYPSNTEFNYSNLGYALLGEVISTVSGVPYLDYVRSHIFEPLGMRATVPHVPESLAGKEAAVGYGRWPRKGARVGVPVRDARALAPARGFASTVQDMARFATWQFRVLAGQENEVLKPDTLREMQTAAWSNPDWGLGFTIWRMGDKEFFGHQGGCPGHKSQFILCPEDRTAVVVLVNATDAPQFTLVFRTHEILAPALAAPAEVKTVSGDWAKYTGYYTADESWSEAEVLERDGALAVMWIPTGDPLGSLVKLRRVEGEVFRQVNGDGSLGKHYVFRADSAGNIVGMKFNNNLLSKTVR